jgi:hypothetical protein
VSGRTRLRRAVAAMALTSATVVTSVIGTSVPADAAVWSCGAGVVTAYNVGYAYCNAGFGSYRVAATCNSPRWPYTRTVYGPWVWRSSGHSSPWSVVSGDDHACHITRAWTQTM